MTEPAQSIPAFIRWHLDRPRDPGLLPVFTMVADEPRYLGDAADHEGAALAALDASIAHGRTSRATLTGDDREFFLVRP